MIEKLYRVEQPDLKKIKVNLELLNQASKPEVKSAFIKAQSPEYLHWKDIKYKNWIPEQFKNHKEKFWLLTKLHRSGIRTKTPICDQNKNYFTWQKLEQYERMLHEITLDMSRYLLDIPEASAADYQKYQSQVKRQRI